MAWLGFVHLKAARAPTSVRRRRHALNSGGLEKQAGEGGEGERELVKLCIAVSVTQLMPYNVVLTHTLNIGSCDYFLIPNVI